jgi:outer membrane lipoprotein SlyB
VFDARRDHACAAVLAAPMMLHPRLAAAMASLALVAGCAARQPVLYRDATYTERGPTVADRTVRECMQAAEVYGEASVVPVVARDTAIGSVVGAAGGAVGGAIWGNAGIGAASGAAAGAVSSLLFSAIQPRRPDPVYMAGVTRCLHDRGYEVLAWQ